MGAGRLHARRLKAVERNAADDDVDGDLTIEELRRFVCAEVPRMVAEVAPTARQNPTVDRDNINVRFRIALAETAGKGPIPTFEGISVGGSLSAVLGSLRLPKEWASVARVERSPGGTSFRPGAAGWAIIAIERDAPFVFAADFIDKCNEGRKPEDRLESYVDVAYSFSRGRLAAISVEAICAGVTGTAAEGESLRRVEEESIASLDMKYCPYNEGNAKADAWVKHGYRNILGKREIQRFYHVLQEELPSGSWAPGEFEWTNQRFAVRLRSDIVIAPVDSSGSGGVYFEWNVRLELIDRAIFGGDVEKENQGAGGPGF